MDKGYDLEFKINGYPIQDLEKYRLVSPEGRSVNLPQLHKIDSFHHQEKAQ